MTRDITNNNRDDPRVKNKCRARYLCRVNTLDVASHILIGLNKQPFTPNVIIVVDDARMKMCVTENRKQKTNIAMLNSYYYIVLVEAF